MNKEEFKKKLGELKQANGLTAQIPLEEHYNEEKTPQENYELIKKIYNLEEPNNIIKENEGKTKDGLTVLKKHNPLLTVVIGGRGSGKTALGHSICDRLRLDFSKPIYTYKHPDPDLMKKRGYHNITQLGDVEDIQNAILWIDEPQLTIPKADKRNNDTLEKLNSIARQKEINIVITTCDTRWVNKSLESYVDLWIIKDIDPELIKQGSKAKNIIKKHSGLSVDGFKLKPSQYLMEYRKDPRFQGKFVEGLPDYWNNNYSTPYATKE